MNKGSNNLKHHTAGIFTALWSKVKFLCDMAKDGIKDESAEASNCHHNKETSSKKDLNAAIENVSCKDNGVISKDILVNGINSVLDEDSILVTKDNGIPSQLLACQSTDDENVQPLNSILDESACVTELVHKLVNSVVTNIDPTSQNPASDEQNLSRLSKEKKLKNLNGKSLPRSKPKTAKSVRTSNRKRVPKKLIDEEKKEPAPVQTVIFKEKIPVPETPIVYHLGDLVWSYVPGHPLWPCMLTNDPLESSCTKMQGTQKKFGRAYHVQFLGDSPEHGWVRGTRVFPYTSPGDYNSIIDDLTTKSKKTNVKVPRIEIPVRLRDDWDSALDEIIEAVECSKEERIEKYEFDFKPHMKEFKHLYNRRNKILVYKECKTLLKDMLRLVCNGFEEHALYNVNMQPFLQSSCNFSSQLKDNSPQFNPSPALCQTPEQSQNTDLRKGVIWKEEILSSAQIQFALQSLSTTEETSYTQSLPEEMKSCVKPTSTTAEIEPSLISNTVSNNRYISSTAWNSDDESLQSDSFEESPSLLDNNSCAKDNVRHTKLSLNQFCDKCTCTALTCRRGGINKSFTYTTKDLLQALDAVADGFKVTTVSMNFNIPRSTISDYARRTGSFKIKHHLKCDIFPPGVSVLTSGFAVHVRAKERVRNLHLTKDVPVQAVPTDANISIPVVVLERNEAAGRRLTRRSKVLDGELLVENDVSASLKNEVHSVQNTTKDCQSKTPPSNLKAHTDIHCSVEDVTSSKSIDDANSGFEFTREQFRLAWRNCSMQKSLNLVKTCTYLRQALLMASKGLSLDEVLGRFHIDINKFNVFVRHHLSRKLPAPRKIIVEPRCRKYSFMQLLQGLDELCYDKMNCNINKVSRKYNIPYSTLKDCHNRNFVIYDQLMNPRMSKRERLAVLKRNVDRLRINVFGLKLLKSTSRSKPLLSDKSGTSSPRPPQKSSPKSVSDDIAVTEVSADESSNPTCSSVSDTSGNICTSRETPKPRKAASAPTDGGVLQRMSQSPHLRVFKNNSFSVFQLHSAIEEARRTGCIGPVATKYRIPFAILQKKLSKTRSSAVSVLDYIIDKELPFALKILTSWGWSLSLKDIRKLVADFLQKQKDWLFDTVVSDIVLLNLCQIHSIPCEVGTDIKDNQLDPFKMAAFNDKLLSLLNIHNIKEYPSHVYMLQEYSNEKTSLCNANKCADQIRHRVLAAFNASGEKHPPLLIFDADSLWCSYEGSYPGSQYALAKSCQLMPSIFENWIERFLHVIKSRPLLLLYDGEITKLPLDLVRKLYEASCVILKLPYSTLNARFQLPYKNVLADAYESISSNDSSTIAEVVRSINLVWTNSLNSDRICKAFSDGGFFPEKSRKSENVESRFSKNKASALVEFKAPLSIVSTSSSASFVKTAVQPEPLGSGDLLPSVHSSAKNEQVERKLASCSPSLAQKHLTHGSSNVKSSKQSPKESQSSKRSSKKTQPSNNKSRNLSRRSSPRLKICEPELPQEEVDSEEDTSLLSENAGNLLSSSNLTSENDGSFAPSSCRIENDVCVSDSVVMESASDVSNSKSISSRKTVDKLPLHLVKTNNSVKAKEAKSPAILAPVETEQPALDRTILYVSYFNRRRGPLQTERPDLTSEQLDSQIRVEWEFLSPNKRKIYGKRNSEDHTDADTETPSPQKRQKKSLKRSRKQNTTESASIGSNEKKKTTLVCNDCGCNYANNFTLRRHRKCCRGKTDGSSVSCQKEENKSADNLIENSIKRLFKCELCNDKFYSNNSLQIHKKFCTAITTKLPEVPNAKKRLKQTDKKQRIKRPFQSLSSAKISKILKTAKSRTAGSNRKKSTIPTEGDDKAVKSAPVTPVSEHQNQADETSQSVAKVNDVASTSARKGRARGRPQLGSNAKRENICIKCEIVDSCPLLTCTAGCYQSIHMDCIEGEKPTEIENYKCGNCIKQTHPCFICNVGPESDRSDLGKIKRCSVQHCGHSYHSTCLHARKLAMIAAAESAENGNGDRYSLLHNYRCTLHNCATCATRFTDSSTSNTAGSRMFRCIRCPTAYHVGDDCIAAGSVILPGLNIICPEHFEPLKTTPYHQPVHVSWCFMCSKGGELVCCEACPAAFHPRCVDMEKPPDGEWFCRDCRHRRRPLHGDIVWVKLGSYRWWPGEITHPNDIPDNIRNLRHDVGEFVVNFFGSNDFFWLNKRRVFQYQEGDTGASTAQCSRGITSVFNKALRDASEQFEKLTNQRQKIQDVRTQKKRPQYKYIKVNRPVGNVQVYVADPSEIPRCICKRTDTSPCGPESECLNRMLMFECHSSLCPAGDKCHNQHFQKRNYPQSEVIKTRWGGWGLKTCVPIKKGQFVNEYVGELVDNEECMRRIEQAHKTNITNFYMLTIDKDRIIDAGPKGNLSRFMNHSCDPSCETQKWTVNGDTRVGLFARRDIERGQELTFNYNLDCLGNDKTPCMCESKNCSGFIGVRPKPQLDSGKNNDQKTKKKRRRTDQREMPKHDDFCFRCRQVGTLVCCDVRGCQRAFCLSCLRLTKPPFGKWECPWHHCDFCGRRAQSFCHFCPNSFCASHVMNQLVLSVPNQYDCCIDHDPNVAEYEMEEAIAAVVASMLPPENWEEEQSPSVEELKTEDESTVKKVEQTSVEKPQRRRQSKETSSEKVEKRKRSRSRKREKEVASTKDEADPPKEELKSTPPLDEAAASSPKKETEAGDVKQEAEVVAPPASADDSLVLTESDIEFGPPTSSPVRRKRGKRQYFRGTKKRRRSKPRSLDASLNAVEEDKIQDKGSAEESSQSLQM